MSEERQPDEVLREKAWARAQELCFDCQSPTGMSARKFEPAAIAAELKAFAQSIQAEARALRAFVLSLLPKDWTVNKTHSDCIDAILANLAKALEP